MNINYYYYYLKPVVPRRFQIFLRRKIALTKKKIHADIWPVHPEAADQPEAWAGWPEGKKFALVLSHDVDSIKGYNKCLQLMNLELENGFKSTFNFVPEGYECSPETRHILTANGFEIGLHGLTHDGRIFQNKKKFNRAVPKINAYLHDWQIKGFSSPSMLGNLDWISQLNIDYDCSTFDTDPFEPQANDVETIFPFIVVNSNRMRSFVELPYTLPQDHCLFIILREKDVSLWQKKLDWIVDQGGMALLNTHPDYMYFGQEKVENETYPADYYRDFLLYVKEKYDGKYWLAQPREVASFWKEKMGHHQFFISGPYRQSALSHLKKNIWIDLDNTPHVPFFIPIKNELKKRGHRVILTARDAYQVKELAEENKLFFKTIGRHYGKNKIKKVVGWLLRSFQLIPFVINNKPAIALSHGSRSQIFIANLFAVPTILIADYEYSRPAPFSSPRWIIVPEALKSAKLPSKRVRTYDGLKEDVYVPFFNPDKSILKNLGISDNELIISVRPPAIEAHYHNPASEKLFYEFVDWVVAASPARIILLPRNKKQESEIRHKRPQWFKDHQVKIPPQVMNGLNLLYFSDIVVSGGGTMNREAASLGIPVYSIFRGPIGRIDRKLEEEGRLTLISSPDDFSKIKLEKREKTLPVDLKARPALEQIIKNIEYIIGQEFGIEDQKNSN
jgi:predicted glycosyltransferase